MFPGGVQHDFDNALDVAVNRRQGPNVHPHAPGERGTHLGGIQLFALDLACFDNILGERLQRCFLAQLKAQGFHAPKQASLQMARLRQQRGQLSLVPLKFRPLFALVNIHLFSAQFTEIIALIRRTSNNIRRMLCGD